MMHADSSRTAAVGPALDAGLASLVERAGSYQLRFARSRDDLDRVLRLRFEVFNLELGEGLQSSFANCRDEDLFDACCHHLLVTHAPTGEVVGTYRMQTQGMADSGQGFYSAAEFDLSALAPRLPRAVELGRACIVRHHRNQRVLFLLWRGLARYLTANGGRYFFGCCSLTGQDAARAWAVHGWLARHGHLHPALQVKVQESFKCPRPAGADSVGADLGMRVPPLMRLYLAHGARIVSPPAVDRRFNTVDFLALIDTDAISDRMRRMFFDGLDH